MMILNSGDRSLIVIEPGNIQLMKEGKPLNLPFNMGMVYTPDIVWTMEQILAVGNVLSIEKLAEILQESLKRPEVYEREYHPKVDVKLGVRKES